VFYGAAGLAFVAAMLVLVLRALPLPTLRNQEQQPSMVTAKVG
jgi:hypothetical protein